MELKQVIFDGARWHKVGYTAAIAVFKPGEIIPPALTAGVAADTYAEAYELLYGEPCPKGLAA